ncbi:MAG: hypothetical protein LC794_10120 [Acidobacteria bacterium]|nr:hypothetical protein [Acidobacteriota bacterium]
MGNEVDHDTLLTMLAEAHARVDAKIHEHSQLLKAAAKADWDKPATDRANEALNEMLAAHKEFQHLLERAEQQLVAEGYVFPPEPTPVPPQVDRLWREELEREKVAVNAYIEDALADGLDFLISRLPQDWWKEQNQRREDFGHEHLRESVVLFGSVSESHLASPIHQYAYALMLARDNLAGRENYDIYSGAFLVPFIAKLCSLIDPLREAKSGFDKLDELRLAPSGEIPSRLYELIVGGRCVLMGRDVEFLPADPAEVTPDLRILNLGFPAVVECKMQSRLSAHEKLEFVTMQELFSALAMGPHRLIGILSIVSTVPLEDVGIKALLEASLKCVGGIDPYQSIIEAWGTISFAPLDPTIELREPTRIYSPDFLEAVFGWDFETTDYDGICALIRNNRSITVLRAELPFCLRWRSEAEKSLDRKARSLASQLSEAFYQVPVGEAGFVYVAYEETHRAAIADCRTQKFLDQIAQWEIRKRGINPQLVVLNRLFLSASHEGRPNLVENAIYTTFGRGNSWGEEMPISVFIDPSAKPKDTAD